MLAHRALVVTILLGLLSHTSGCGAQPGRKLVTYNAATTDLPKPLVANKDGIYGLYPDDGLTPVDKVHLKRGQSIGFRRGNDGRIVGYAGDKEYGLTAVLATEYTWKFLGAGAEQK